VITRILCAWGSRVLLDHGYSVCDVESSSCEINVQARVDTFSPVQVYVDLCDPVAPKCRHSSHECQVAHARITQILFGSVW
jgi:hypothetical protein